MVVQRLLDVERSAKAAAEAHVAKLAACNKRLRAALPADADFSDDDKAAEGDTHLNGGAPACYAISMVMLTSQACAAACLPCTLKNFSLEN